MAQEVEHILGKDEVTSSSLVSSSTKKHDVGRVFLICAKFVCTNLCDLFQKSHVEPVVCARCLFLQAIPHLRLPSAALWFILSQEPVGCVRGFLLPAISASSLAVISSIVFYNRSLSAAVLFVWFFNFIISWIFL